MTQTGLQTTEDALVLAIAGRHDAELRSNEFRTQRDSLLAALEVAAAALHMTADVFVSLGSHPHSAEGLRVLARDADAVIAKVRDK